MNDLTVVICFLNEGEEVERTVKSLRESAGGAVDVLLLNDCSDDGFDYATVAGKYGCRLENYEKRLGPSVLRGRGVDAAKTEKVLLLDSHMRFHDDRWYERIVDAIDEDPRAVYSVKTPAIDAEGKRTGAPVGMGTSVSLKGEPNEKDPRDICWHLLDPVWRNDGPYPGEAPPVACVLGGAYAFDKEFFHRIGGHIGQVRYGAEEPYLSTKAWLSGGACRLLTRVSISHIYRDAREVPFYTPAGYTVHNKMVYVGTTFPEERFGFYKEKFAKVPAGKDGARYFRKSAAFVRKLRSHFQERVFKRPFEFWEELNADFRAGKDISDRIGAGI